MLQPSAGPVAPMAPAQPGGIGLAPEIADIADALPTMRRWKSFKVSFRASPGVGSVGGVGHGCRPSRQVLRLPCLETTLKDAKRADAKKQANK